MREYLFEYHFSGSTWGITIHADSMAEAKEKIKAVGMANYKGETYAHLRVGSQVNLPLLALGIVAAIAAVFVLGR